MTRTGMDHDVRAVADAVLYEGYLLYPYRAGSAKNQSRCSSGFSDRPAPPRSESARNRRCPRNVCSANSSGTASKFLRL